MHKRRTREAESTDASIRRGLPHSSDDAGVMLAERRGQVTGVGMEPTCKGRSPNTQWKTAVFARWHEPDEARVSRPESVSGSGGSSPGRLGASTTSRHVRCSRESKPAGGSDGLAQEQRGTIEREAADLRPRGMRQAQISIADLRQDLQEELAVRRASMRCAKRSPSGKRSTPARWWSCRIR